MADFALKMQCASERDEHKALVHWLSLHPRLKFCYLHVHNEMVGNDRFHAKRLGIRKGVFDFFIALPNKHYHGLWIELKRRIKYNISKEQRQWQTTMIANGYEAIFAIGWDEAREAIIAYVSDLY